MKPLSSISFMNLLSEELFRIRREPPWDDPRPPGSKRSAPRSCRDFGKDAAISLVGLLDDRIHPQSPRYASPARSAHIRIFVDHFDRRDIGSEKSFDPLRLLAQQ